MPTEAQEHLGPRTQGGHVAPPLGRRREACVLLPAFSRARTWGLDLACHPRAHRQVQAKRNTPSEPLLRFCPPTQPGVVQYLFRPHG